MLEDGLGRPRSAVLFEGRLLGTSGATPVRATTLAPILLGTYPAFIISWVFLSNFGNFKLKKLLLDSVLESSRCDHWIP